MQEFNISNFKYETLQNTIERKDDEILKTRDKTKYFVCHSRKRTVKTEMGTLTYYRRFYRYFDEEQQVWKRIALVDQKYGVKTRARLINSLHQKILDQISTNKRYRDIQDSIPDITFSKMTISRIFRQQDLYEELNKESENKIELKDGQNLYINTDDAYLDLIYESKPINCMIRTLSINTGIDIEKSKWRNVLGNKRTFFLIKKPKESITHEKFSEYILQKIDMHYTNWENANLILGGDGATWIRLTADKINAKSVLDKFHSIKWLWTLHLPRQNRPEARKYYLQSKKLYENGEYEEFINSLDKGRDQHKQKCKQYFENNKKAIENENQPWNIGVSAESDVSHLVKSTLGYGCKIYNFNTYKNMLSGKALKINNKI